VNASQTKKWISSIKHVQNSWIKGAVRKVPKRAKSAEVTRVFVMFSQEERRLEKALKDLLSDRQIQRARRSKSPIEKFEGSEGSIYVVFPKALHPEKSPSKASLAMGAYGACRDALGTAMGMAQNESSDSIQVLFVDTPQDSLHGGLVGIDIASYRFRKVISGDSKNKKLILLKNKGEVTKREIDDASAVAVGVNLARHLVNLPPNVLKPAAYAQSIKSLFQGVAGVKVDVWDKPRLKKENCNLLLAVGEASSSGPCLVHLRYRPKGSSSKKPVAFVGKGITFDSGGLDIKPSQAMRLMKKDMGGSAALVGLAHSCIQSGLKTPMDFYFCLAENAVDDHAFRPSDVYISRSGISVEIDNTDAEGRLVMADGLDVAVSAKGKEAPSVVIDVSTLTGAIKVGLGADIGGLFSDNDKLANQLFDSGLFRSDRVWRMPLFDPYNSSLRSDVADTVNSASGFGGAITAALFLRKFTRGIPWAHFDIYAWSDSSSGALLEKGGSGQAVQCLYEWCHKFSGKS
tara:strand:+ start:23525 stop:25072 length:1548 start_codon:yes stop_codon:yes gene_type:complete